MASVLSFFKNLKRWLLSSVPASKPFYPHVTQLRPSRRSWSLSHWLLIFCLIPAMSHDAWAFNSDKKKKKIPPQQHVVREYLRDRFTFTSAEVAAILKLSQSDQQMLLVYFSADFIQRYEIPYILSALTSIQERHADLLLSYKAQLENDEPVIQNGDETVTYKVRVRYVDGNRTHYSDFPESFTVVCEVLWQGKKSFLGNCLIDDLEISEEDNTSDIP